MQHELKSISQLTQATWGICSQPLEWSIS